jgi:dTDP-4-dehydrorhamnose 3,5-epimerase
MLNDANRPETALDLRVGSPTYGKHEVYELSTAASNAVYLPRGIAHGFCVRQAPAVMVYHVTSEHDPSLDAGIHWNSFGAAWPVDNPTVSARDDGFIGFDEFKSPFRFEELSPGRTSEDVPNPVNP